MIRLKTLLKEQQAELPDFEAAEKYMLQNPRGGSTDNSSRKTSSNKTVVKTVVPGSQNTEEEDLQLVKELLSNISDSFLTAYDKIDKLYDDDTHWEGFKDEWGDDEELAVTHTYGDQINSTGTWWHNNIYKSHVLPIETWIKEYVVIIKRSPKIGEDTRDNIKKVLQNRKQMKDLFGYLKKYTLGNMSSDELVWDYMAGITDEDTGKVFKVDTDF